VTVPVDLRSDTVTRPTPAMRRAMADAEVGDDLYGEDPTVNRLQEMFAQRVGKEAALFVPSGTMGNQVALRVLTQPGTAVVAGRRQHVVAYENGAAAIHSGVLLLTLDDHDGTIDPVEVAHAVAGVHHHNPRVSAVCVENTHMPANGAVWPLDRLEAVAAAGPPMHLDGARLFNASVATGVDPARFAAPAVTVMSCLSKGLAAPVGSLLAGPADVIAEARGVRAILGGAMRQVGVLAAAGIVALEEMVDRLAEDHEHAGLLADAVLDRWPDCGLDRAAVRTNIVVFHHPEPARLLEHLASQGVRAGTIAPGVVRFVTHVDVDRAGIDRARAAVAAAP
jgi:threonine aldolase